MRAEATGGVLFVHAHPDDESMGTGGTIARLAAEGVRVDLVTCTDGAEGEIHDPTLDADEARPRLAQIRAAELACSVDALGSGAIHHHVLGYRDSGMIGTDANAHPDSFWQADLDEATQRLTEIVRASQPSAIVSYDENGNYGHPDHINAARIARQAYQASRGEAWQVARFYEVAFVRERWSELMTTMKERGIALPWDFDDETQRLGETADQPEEGDGVEFGRSDAEVTTRVDVSGHLDAKRRSMDCHKTQRQDLGWLLDLPDDLADQAIDTEYYVLRWLDGSDVDSTRRETWLLGA
jgi:N-acetyl-1-D-myo-inositol-2-amino-2-deoxy-alpha-D-glucopyranoside deacetylase